MNPFPKSNPIIASPRALMALATLVGFAFVSVALARINDVPTAPMPLAPVVETVRLAFVDGEDGGVLALNEADGSVHAVVEPLTGGFVRGVLRALVRERMKLGMAGAAGAFEINRLADGHITLSDPATGLIIDLGAFGSTNMAAFAAIMDGTPTEGAAL
ncbi:photosynthetic complex assembly protein PuhC [Acuticoccus sp.]|uniref:photosynthetic complex assembly protein PuhC n=1 Tax=Acuticoccus sp. TaxID=1904378 RepID=UPI003B52EE6D